MIAIADILQAGEKLTAVAPFLAGIQNEEQYTQALELVDHLLLNDPENPLLDLVCAKITAWEESAPEFAEFSAMAQAMPGGIAVIRTLMDQYGLTLSDLPEIGSKSMVSRVLSGKRKLTLEHAKKLATRFGISPALFIDYRDVPDALHPALQITI
ncbi:TPA: type II toxin-antitoxin system HigA family antitoxin [Escherichia coli]